MTPRSCCRIVLALVSGAACLPSVVFAQKSPEEALKSLRPAKGFDVSLYASEPLITNPAAIDIDTQGRVWVAEIQWYRSKAKTPPADKIKVLEDTDGDGRADKATVFADGLFAPMSICVAGDKVYVATSPDLWEFEDKNGDLKADGPPKKLLTGFGGHNHDHGAHSLVLGPDHKWWMAHGDAGFDVTGTDGAKIKYQWGAMLRGELDGSKLETVAVNFRNSYEICVSSFGEPFCSDNDNDGNQSSRICWIMEGGDYGWFGSPPPRAPAGTPFGEHWHFRGHIPGHVPATLVTGFGSPCGICFYEGDAFGEPYRNAPLHTDPGPREVRVYPHEVAGAGMRARSEVFLTSEGDDYFRADDICTAPDGSLLVSDWYDGGVGGHGYNNPDQGRIYLLKPTGKALKRTEKPGPYDNIPDAIAGLQSPNLATQYLARERLLTEGERSVPALKELLAAPEANARARALWVLDRIGGEARKLVIEELKSSDARFRALAVRILRRHGNEQADAVLALAGDDSLEVVREVLLGIRKFQGDKADAALAQIARRYDGSDRYLLEAINIAAADRKSALYQELVKEGMNPLQQFQLLQLLNPSAAADLLAKKLTQSGVSGEAAKVLLAAAGTISSPDAGKILLKLAADSSASDDVRLLAFEKLSSNLGGTWKSLLDDDQTNGEFRKLLTDRLLQQSAMDTAGKTGMRKLGGDVLAMATSTQTSSAARVKAIQVTAQLGTEGTGPALRSLIDDGEPAVRQAALDALVDLQDMKVLREILPNGKIPAASRSAVVERLMKTAGGALGLHRLVDEGRLPPELEQLVIARAVNHPDANVRVIYEDHLPPDQRPQRLGMAIKPEEILALEGNAERGQKIFSQSSAAQCKNCHTIDGQGGSLGPDLSMIGKKFERNTLLETILDPSKAVAPEYVSYLLETVEGQVYAGFVVEKTARDIVLKDAESKLIRVAADNVEVLQPQKKSLMPELVLRDVSAQDAADLLAYLTTLNHGLQSVGSFRILGPFDTNRRHLGTVFEPERTLANPDLKASYAGMDGKPNTWELVSSDGSLGFAGIDTVKYDNARGLRSNVVTHYFLVYADSAAEQQATLLVGSDDSCKVWVNGQQVHEKEANRPLGFGQDEVSAKLQAGRNAIVVKVVNNQGPGGVSLAIRGTADVQLRTE